MPLKQVVFFFFKSYLHEMHVIGSLNETEYGSPTDKSSSSKPSSAKSSSSNSSRLGDVSRIPSVSIEVHGELSGVPSFSKQLSHSHLHPSLSQL